MKKTLGILLILVVAVLGGYYGMGLLTERTIRHNLEAMNRSNGLFVNVISYHRGWFTSEAMLDWKFHVPERVVKSGENESQIVPAQDFNTTMKLDVYHGPIMFVHRQLKFGLGYATTDLGVPEQYEAQFKSFFTSESTAPKLELSIFVTYLNDSQIQLSLPNFKLFAKKGGEFDWLGLNSVVRISSDAGKIKGEVALSGIEMSKDDINISVGQIKSSYALHKTETGLYLGDANVLFPTLTVKKKGQMVFEMSGFDVNSNSKVTSGLFSSHFKSTLEKIIANGKTYGPGVLDLSIRNLDAQVLSDINQKLNQVSQGTEIEKQKALFSILSEIPKLFSKGPEFELTELSFVMPQGTLEGSILVTLPANASVNPFELFQKIQGKGKFRVPVDLMKLVLNEINQQKRNQSSMPETSSDNSVENSLPNESNTSLVVSNEQKTAEMMANKQLEAMIQSGLFVQSGNSYVMTISLENGKLSVNGAPFTPGMLKLQ